MADIASPVWERIGMTRNEPGELSLVDGVLTLQTEQGVRFSASATQIQDPSWPWISRNAAFNFTINGEKFRLSFARPNGAGAAWRPVSATIGVLDLGSAMKTGKAWRTELGM